MVGSMSQRSSQKQKGSKHGWIFPSVLQVATLEPNIVGIGFAILAGAVRSYPVVRACLIHSAHTPALA